MMNWIELNTFSSIQLNWIQQFDFKLNWIEFKINQRKMGCKLVEKGMEIKIYSWTLCCKEKISKIYKYKKSHLHASLHGNGLNVFQFGIV